MANKPKAGRVAAEDVTPPDPLESPEATISFVLDRLLTYLQHAIPHNPADPAAAQALSDLARLRDRIKSESE